MPEVADGDGGSSSPSSCPCSPLGRSVGRHHALRSSVTLDQDSDRPVSILRNPRTGQIPASCAAPRPWDLARGDTVSALREPGMEVMTSRPGPGGLGPVKQRPNFSPPTRAEPVLWTPNWTSSQKITKEVWGDGDNGAKWERRFPNRRFLLLCRRAGDWKSPFRPQECRAAWSSLD